MRCLRLSAVLLTVVLWVPAHVEGQLQPFSEVFPVWRPTLEQRDPYTGPFTSFPGSPIAVALRHGFAVASLGSTSNNDMVVDGKLVDLSGQPGPKFLGRFVENGFEPFLADPALAAAGPGGFVLVWANQSFDVNYRRFGPGGVPLGDYQYLAEEEGYYCSPAVAGNASGGFVIAWEGNGCYGYGGVSVRAFDSSGVSATAELAIPVPEGFDVSAMPRVGLDAAGRFVVLWRQAGATAADPVRLCGQAYGARGGFLGAPFCVGDLAEATGGALAIDPAGSFLAAWFGPAAAGGPAPLFVRRYRMNGTPLGGPVQVAAAVHPSHLTASADARGNAALSWVESDRMRVLLVRRDAVAKGPAITITGVASPRGVSATGVALADSGRLLVTWKSGDLILGRLWRARF